MIRPVLSVVIPIHNMRDGDAFLWRLVNSLTEQTFQDFEIIITKNGKMAENTNSGIKRARGDLIKILFLDDCLAEPDSLKKIVDNFKEKDHWLITGAQDNPSPYWTDDIEMGNNKLGSPSALTIRNDDNPLLFDENMSWLLDCDYYRRMYNRYGKPRILSGVHVYLGKGPHQMTNILTTEHKLAEHNYMYEKYNK